MGGTNKNSICDRFVYPSERGNIITYIFSVPIIITLALIAFTYMNYESIPEVFATHWNGAGEVDGWTQKSRLSVISMPLILLAIQISFS